MLFVVGPESQVRGADVTKLVKKKRRVVPLFFFFSFKQVSVVAAEKMESRVGVM